MILVTGATGTNGRELLRRLSALGVTVRAMVRPRDGREQRPISGCPTVIPSVKLFSTALSAGIIVIEQARWSSGAEK